MVCLICTLVCTYPRNDLFNRLRAHLLIAKSFVSAVLITCACVCITFHFTRHSTLSCFLAAESGSPPHWDVSSATSSSLSQLCTPPSTSVSIMDFQTFWNLREAPSEPAYNSIAFQNYGWTVKLNRLGMKTNAVINT